MYALLTVPLLGQEVDKRTIAFPLNFHGPSDFSNTQFDGSADFGSTQFHVLADFGSARFAGTADFSDAQFAGQAYFGFARFDSLADFWSVQFASQAYFGSVQFAGQAYFGFARFDSLADFGGAGFDKLADFRGAEFDRTANFRAARFAGRADFRLADFKKKIDFREAEFVDSATVADFSLAIIRDTVLIGIQLIDIQEPGSSQRYDFMRANLIPAGEIMTPADTSISDSQDTTIIPAKTTIFPGSKIILYGPVDLKIQLEKLEFVDVYDSLNYYSKKDIISVLKDKSFAKNKAALFEIDYLFARSTMYQKVSVEYEKYSVFHPLTWWRFLYNVTMGLGYRPFRLIYWALFLIIGFGIVYLIKIPRRINDYIAKDEKQIKSSRSRIKSDNSIYLSETIINCIYFSAMVLFTFRLKRDILTFFNIKEKRIIVSQWLLGFLIYVAFLTLSKSGSILQNLKDLFIG